MVESSSSVIVITAVAFIPLVVLLFLLCESLDLALVVLDGIEGPPTRAACGSFVDPERFKPVSEGASCTTEAGAAPVNAARDCALSVSGSAS